MKTPDGVGELGRLAAIARVAAEKGWGHYAERLQAPRQGGEAPGPALRADDARRLREALEELGPTFVKLGQMMAGRSDIFPEEMLSELSKLHEHAAAFPAHVARRIVEEETGRAIAELYASFEEAPLAAASMAQVHRAALRDGSAVIVKVQRPDIAGVVEGDISVLRRVARVLDTALPAARAFNLPDLVEEFAEVIRGELDFEREARNAERFADLNRDQPEIYVPRVYWEATTRRVLTMEYSPGRRLAAGTDPRADAELAQRLMRLFLEQVFERGVFHGDPHAGNVFVLADGRICYHDFGAVGELSPQVQEKLRELFLGVIARDAGWVASAYLALGGASGELDRGRFTRDLGDTLDRYYREAAYGEQAFSAILQAFVRLGRRHHVHLLREVALLVRAFAELETLARGVDARFSSLEAFRAYSGVLLKHAFVPQVGVAQAAQLYRMVSASREVASGAPVMLRRLMGRIERGEPVFDIRHDSGPSVERQLLHASNRLAFAIIVAALVVGSSIVLAAHAGPHIGDVSVLGILGFVVAGLLGTGWAVIALRSGKL